MQPHSLFIHQNSMKISKTILTGMIAGVALVGINTSCTKEEIKKNEEPLNVNRASETEGEHYPMENYDCPACGLG